MNDALARLPHEYPFRFADRVTARSGPGEGAVRVMITAGSWSGRAFPAVFVGELIAQSALLLQGGDADLGRSGFLAGLSGIAVERTPEPGDALTVEVRVLARFGAITRFTAELRDDEGLLVARGEVTVRKGEAADAS
jgi:3-hydroxyacyl-[acyl-carrier-protein] dehydratase